MSARQFVIDHARLLAIGSGILVLGLLVEARAFVPQGGVPGGGTQGDDPGRQPSRAALPAIATADSNGDMIAVTGIDVTGASILYLIDTHSKQLAVYQANGGSDSSQGIKLVGARRIDLDLQLEGYNDRSRYSYEELERQFNDLQQKSPK